MTESVAQRTNAMADNSSAGELYKLLEAVRADIVAIRAAIVEMGSKLDADSGVTATDFEADATTTLGTQQTVA